MNTHTSQRGTLLVVVLVFGSVFFLIVSSFAGFVVTQSRVQEAKYQYEQAREIAEAGLNYYKWYLAHNPDDTTNGTGNPGPYVIPYTDQESGAIGEFSLEIASSTFCGEVYSIEITSTGYTYDNPDRTRTVYGRYAQPTVAEYAYIINSNVWAGSDRTIIGPYHSNGGIRMDGTNNSTVTSGQETWTCTSSFGCSPTQSVDGVFGDGPNSDLWSYPSAPINFTGLTVDLSTMYDRAKNGGGIYIPDSGDWGYHVDFQSDGTVDVSVVDRVWNNTGYSSEGGTNYNENNILRDTDFYATYTIDPQCPLIFVEDKVWLEGDINQKVSIAAADIDTTGNDYSIILNGNIEYTTASSGLLAIAEEDMLIGIDVPDDMELNGIFVAQNGRFGRNLYHQSYLPNPWGSLNFKPYYKRDTLTINGTIVSNGRVGTKWICSGSYCSGFDTRYNSYDRDLIEDPPPLTPNTSDDYRFIEWREVE